MSDADSTAGYSRIRVWDAPLRVFHWLLVIAMAVAFLSAEEGSPINHWHMLSGWVAAILIAFRIVWGFVGGEFARFSGIFKSGGIFHHMSELLSFKPKPSMGPNPLGWIDALLLIAVSVGTIWTGALMVTSAGEAAEDLHEVMGWGLLALVAIHIAAVFIMSFLTRDNLLRAMASGTKHAGRHPGARDAKKPRLYAYVISLAVIIAAIFGILKIDPQAFVPRSTESAEYGENGESHELQGEEMEYDGDD